MLGKSAGAPSPQTPFCVSLARNRGAPPLRPRCPRNAQQGAGDFQSSSTASRSLGEALCSHGGVGAAPPLFRVAKRRKGLGRVRNTRPSWRIHRSSIFPRVALRRECEGGEASFGNRAVKKRRKGRAARSEGRRGGRRGSQPASPTSRAFRPVARPDPERCRFPLRELRSLLHSGWIGADGRAQRGGRNGTKDRVERRSGSAQGAGCGSNRKPARRRPPHRPETSPVPPGRRVAPSPSTPIRPFGFALQQRKPFLVYSAA